MSVESWLLYALAVLVLTAAPGPSVLLCITKSVTSGFHSSIYSALGSLSAIVGIMTFSFTGLGVLIASSETVFNVVKWLGAAYLIYLGIKAFTSPSHTYQLDNESLPDKKESRMALFRSGFIVGASNPKAIVFFTALFPQFIVAQQSLLLQYFIFAITFAVMELFWLLFYAYLGAKSSRWLLRDGRAQFFNKITGGVFIGAGVLLSSVRPTA